MTNDVPIEQFRARAAAWLEANAPRRVADTEDGGRLDTDTSPIAVQKQFQAALHDAGLAGITWPREYGGQGLGDVEESAFHDLARDYVLPVGAFVVSLNTGLTLLDCGSAAQKKEYLRKLVRGEHIWCQLFSEPAAGSDLAALRTTATRVEDGWRLNGQKVWTSSAQHSDYGIVLARTDPSLPKHRGLTMFIVDMHAPGVMVRPLRVATGDTPFNEVFLDDVWLPPDSVIGETNGGWRVALVTLRHEREHLGTMVRSRRQPLSSASLRELACRDGAELTETQRQALARLAVRETAVRLFGQAIREELSAKVPIGARGSVAKLTTDECGVFAIDTAVEVLGDQLGALTDPELQAVAEDAIRNRGWMIAGGTTQIQRNIIAERILGQPKDLGADRDTPFNQSRSGDAQRR